MTDWKNWPDDRPIPGEVVEIDLGYEKCLAMFDTSRGKSSFTKGYDGFISYERTEYTTVKRWRQFDSPDPIW